MTKTDKYGEWDRVQNSDGSFLEVLPEAKATKEWKDERKAEPDIFPPKPRDAAKELDELKAILRDKGIL